MPRSLVLIVLAVITLVAIGTYYLVRQTSFSRPPSPTPPSTAQECKVAGCSGQVCAEAQIAKEIVTDCELKAEYACYKNARCEPQSSGECGWTQDEALVKCLKETSEDAMPLGIE